MELFDALETFGVPITMCIAFGYFIWKQNKWIQDDLKKDMEEQAKRLEGSYRSLSQIIQKLSGNGLKKK